MIRGLSDSTGLPSVRIPGLDDTVFAAEEFYNVVDLRPAESAFAVESERFANFRIKVHGLENCGSQWLRSAHSVEFGGPVGRDHVNGDGTPNTT